MVLVGLFFCVRKWQESMGDMELWRKSNLFWGIRFGLERGWCCLRGVCGIMGKGKSTFSFANYDEKNSKFIAKFL